MKVFTQLTALLALTVVVATACDKDDDNNYEAPPQVAQSTVVTASGDSSTIAAKLVEFRALLGDPLNTTPNQTTGRREVNWDGVPPALTNNSNFPLDFFNPTDANGPAGRKRGLQYAAGTLLRVDTTDFSEIDASYAAQFEPFSRKRLLSPVGTNITNVVFKSPGTNTDATVKGFGAIFSDVDNASSTFIEFFNGTKSLGVFKVPAAAGASKYSFLGVQFIAERITHLRITAGNAALATGVKDVTNGGTKDLVTIDDFLYSEPLTN